MTTASLQSRIFSIASSKDFNSVSLEVFRFQYANNAIYREFCQALSIDPGAIEHFSSIPFLPIEFFKQHDVICGQELPSLVFTSSGTTGKQTSRHYVKEPGLYTASFLKSFELFFGKPEEFHILALLPGYLERTGSSLIYMADKLIKLSNSAHSGFYLDELAQLQKKITDLEHDPRRILLLGVSFALLDMAEKYPVKHPRMQVMETGGMKGRRKELIRFELHHVLGKSFGLETICSEYGMTELLSQAYSTGKGIFHSPPWMKILIRETHDPLTLCLPGTTGGINIIDLANLYSCSFIATQDLGKSMPGGGFEVTGRFDSSDIRGCNLMVS